MNKSPFPVTSRVRESPERHNNNSLKRGTLNRNLSPVNSKNGYDNKELVSLLRECLKEAAVVGKNKLELQSKLRIVENENRLLVEELSKTRNELASQIAYQHDAERQYQEERLHQHATILELQKSGGDKTVRKELASERALYQQLLDRYKELETYYEQLRLYVQEKEEEEEE